MTGLYSLAYNMNQQQYRSNYNQLSLSCMVSFLLNSLLHREPEQSWYEEVQKLADKYISKHAGVKFYPGLFDVNDNNIWYITEVLSKPELNQLLPPALVQDADQWRKPPRPGTNEEFFQGRAYASLAGSSRVAGPAAHRQASNTLFEIHTIANTVPLNEIKAKLWHIFRHDAYPGASLYVDGTDPKCHEHYQSLKWKSSYDTKYWYLAWNVIMVFGVRDQRCSSLLAQLLCAELVSLYGAWEKYSRIRDFMTGDPKKLKAAAKIEMEDRGHFLFKYKIMDKYLKEEVSITLLSFIEI